MSIGCYNRIWITAPQKTAKKEPMAAKTASESLSGRPYQHRSIEQMQFMERDHVDSYQGDKDKGRTDNGVQKQSDGYMLRSSLKKDKKVII